MCALHWVVTTVLTAFLFVPLLTELGSNHNGHHYKHGAPNGAVLWGPCPIPAETARNWNSLHVIVTAQRLYGRPPPSPREAKVAAPRRFSWPTGSVPPMNRRVGRASRLPGHEFPNRRRQAGRLPCAKARWIHRPDARGLQALYSLFTSYVPSMC
jgi:hypothetical protein